MQATRMLDRDRIVAGALAIAINATLLALLMQQMHWQAAPRRAEALSLVWVAAPPATVPALAPAMAPDARPRDPLMPARTPRRPLVPRAAARSPSPLPDQAPAPEATPATEPAGARPLTAVLLMQARQAAGPRAEDFAAPPLANRPVTVPGRVADTFHMSEPLSAAKVVAGIGKLFGGSGYSADACPDLRRQVARLGLADSEADRRHAVELAQALCP
ncbi:hypothetical protein [Lysobacter sp. A3-1-A15]|uniref:hypothetical protein n=1 Tax=Novilysobacter viscosus TaxID=3098602 RepID=UPI002EDACAB0